MSDPRDERAWDRGWDEHRDAQARRMAALSLIEKLDWLEEAQERVRMLQARSGEVRDGRAEPTRGKDQGSTGPA